MHFITSGWYQDETSGEWCYDPALASYLSEAASISSVGQQHSGSLRGSKKSQKGQKKATGGQQVNAKQVASATTSAASRSKSEYQKNDFLSSRVAQELLELDICVVVVVDVIVVVQGLSPQIAQK